VNAHPAAELFPALNAATEAALRRSIEQFGVLVPVLVDQHGEILDGNHRVRFAGEIGVTYPTHVIEIPDGADVAEMLISLNDDRRPRLTLEQRREAVVALREEGHSLRAIAGAVGVKSTKTVRDDLAANCAPGAQLVPERVTGLDGKSRPAMREKPPSPEPRRGFRRNRDRPFEITKPRHAEVAQGHKRKLDGALAAISGYCTGLADFDLGIAVAGASPGDLVAWEQLASKAATTLNELKRALKEARNGTAS
jgi:ParB-like chromosome segregation protein Spo0J